MLFFAPQEVGVQEYREQMDQLHQEVMAMRLKLSSAKEATARERSRAELLVSQVSPCRLFLIV